MTIQVCLYLVSIWNIVDSNLVTYFVLGAELLYSVMSFLLYVF